MARNSEWAISCSSCEPLILRKSEKALSYSGRINNSVMQKIQRFSLFILCLLCKEFSLGQGIAPPIIPIADDAYLQWEKLPYQRIGMRAYMRSTYDREGNNRRADASHYLYQENDSFNVTLDVAGPGILYFKRTNFFHGRNWFS